MFDVKRSIIFSNSGIAWDNKVLFCHATGGGDTYNGKKFYPDGSEHCRSVGSHGGAYNTLYSGCTGSNLELVINLRGKDEHIVDIIAQGAINSCVVFMQGGGGMWLMA